MMAPNSRKTVSCRLLFVLGAFMFTIAFVLVLYHNEVLVAVRSIAQADCPNIPGHEHNHVQNEQNSQYPQRTILTTYSDLSLLEDLPDTNVIWINTTLQPEAWGISMFHSLHCLKMWKESLLPETAMKSHVHGDNEYAEHSHHCISYLVQVG